MNYWITVLLFLTNSRAGLTGYAESRLFLPAGESVNFYGYSRGWLEFKAAQEFYGGQAVFDITLPFDSLPDTGFKGGLEISRLAVWLGPENLRVTCGKQRILWGVARVFRPLDIFNPMDFFEPGYERPGIPAVLANFAAGPLTDVRLLWRPRYRLGDGQYAGRFGTNLLRNDIGLNAFYRPAGSEIVVGGDLAGEFYAGYWVEGAYTKNDSAGYGKIAFGLDYTFPGMIYGMAEYFFDQSGAGDPADYDYRKLRSGERSTLGRDYLYASLVVARGLVFSPGLYAIANLDDRSGILIPQATYLPWENTELTLGIGVPFGTGEFRTTAAYDELVFLRGKVYF